jgi:hypothetical protein
MACLQTLGGVVMIFESIGPPTVHDTAVLGKEIFVKQSVKGYKLLQQQ